MPGRFIKACESGIDQRQHCHRITMEELNQAQRQRVQQILLQLQSDLGDQLNMGKAATEVVELDQTAIGRLSRMDAMQQQRMAVSTRERTAAKLAKVKAALKALTDNEYGYCRQCDEAIAYPRLLAQPEANYCLPCQDQADRQQ
ncbi:MAG: TraR/DksA C4-type zinc finger protein [Proteobacteria bacterium]|nr:TraR/DksA C4-type zinc finger protein [Pseudomonadota bacterium]